MSIKSIIKNLVGSAKSALNSEDPFLVQKHLFADQQNLVIFDVGAYVGNITAIYTKTFPLAELYCFEPFTESFQELGRLAEHGHIKPYQIAFSDQNGKAMYNTPRI